MTAETNPCRKKWKIAVGILLAVLVLVAGGFFWYVSDYYRTEDVALEVLASGDPPDVRDDLTILSPSYPTDTAIIFYPGAKVEAAAYVSGLVLGLLSMVIALLGVAVLVAYSPQNGLILLVIAFLISSFGLPRLAFWLLGQVQGLKYAIQDLIYG